MRVLVGFCLFSFLLNMCLVFVSWCCDVVVFVCFVFVSCVVESLLCYWFSMSLLLLRSCLFGFVLFSLVCVRFLL